MLTLEDCIALCGLSEDEVHAIAEHERLPQAVAAELGNYLIHCTDGELRIKAIIRDDIARAAAIGHRARQLALKAMLRNFILRHPLCEERHREAPRAYERRTEVPDALARL